jgi:hypothetical protein
MCGWPWDVMERGLFGSGEWSKERVGNTSNAHQHCFMRMSPPTQ